MMQDIPITFAQLRRNAKKNMCGMPTYRLAVLGDCATQHLSVALKGFAYTHYLALEVFDADYNQILPQVMDSCSQLYEFNPSTVLVYMCVENLHASWCDTPDNARSGFAENSCSRIKEYWRYISSNCQANILQFTFAENDDAVFGNYSVRKFVVAVFE